MLVHGMNLYVVSTMHDARPGHITPAYTNTWVVAESVVRAVSEVRKLYPNQEVTDVTHEQSDVIVGEFE